MNNYNPQNDPVINAWKPIADAPKDGTPIVGSFYPERDNSNVVCWWEEHALNKNWSGWVYNDVNEGNYKRMMQQPLYFTTIHNYNDPPNPTRLKELAVLKAVAQLERKIVVPNPKATFSLNAHICVMCGKTQEFPHAKRYPHNAGCVITTFKDLLADPTYASFLAGLEASDGDVHG